MENAEVLALDAMQTGGPQVYAVLTTRSAVLAPAPFYRAREKVMRALKRRWPSVEYVAQVEFTTGRAGTSGGRRRPHWNLLLKGVPVEDLAQAQEVLVRVWCDRVDAEPAGQYVGLVEHAGGLMRYLALHFNKQSQAPPKGWRGHRFLHSRGYFPEGIQTGRAQARDDLQVKREVYKLDKCAQEQGHHLDAQTLYELVEERRAEQRALTWKLVQIYELAGDKHRQPPRLPAIASAASRQRGERAAPTPPA